MHPFLTDDAKRRIKRAVQAFEAQTSAELVVAVDVRARSYREGAWGCACVAGFLALLFLLFDTHEFDVRWIPLDVALAGLSGWAVSAFLPRTRLLFVSRRGIAEAVCRAAHMSFVTRGITKTAGRSGVLVHASLLERVACIVCDAGVASPVVATCASKQSELAACIRRRDVDGFAAALKSWGSEFNQHMPRSADDVNELSDEVQ